MGYNGLGMQRWIYTMKPRKFFGKRNKPNGDGQENIAGHEMKDYYHLKPNNLDNLRQKKFTTEYREKLGKQIKAENRNQKLYTALSIIVSIVFFVFLYLYFSGKFELF